MFNRITRLPLRRCLHTASTTAQSASSRTAMGPVGRVALCASAAATALISYNFASERSKLHLDSASTSTRLSASKPPSAAPSSTTSSTSSSEGSPESSTSTSLNGTPSTTSPSSEQPEGEKSSGGGQGGAYNPETGEINWDCPCLGGMAHGPCGEQFKEAFSCFVFSEDEPKGINCVDAFKKMQDCFREHPEHYADEIMDDDDDDNEPSRPITESAEGQALEKAEEPVAEASSLSADPTDETTSPAAAVKKAGSSSELSSPSH